MGRKIGGAALLLVAALMLPGFARSSASMGSPTALFALLITVALPGAGDIVLLRGSPARSAASRWTARRAPPWARQNSSEAPLRVRSK